jgi:hypothetical protein
MCEAPLRQKLLDGREPPQGRASLPQLWRPRPVPHAGTRRGRLSRSHTPAAYGGGRPGCGGALLACPAGQGHVSAGSLLDSLPPAAAGCTEAGACSPERGARAHPRGTWDRSRHGVLQVWSIRRHTDGVGSHSFQPQGGELGRLASGGLSGAGVLGPHPTAWGGRVGALGLPPMARGDVAISACGAEPPFESRRGRRRGAAESSRRPPPPGRVHRSGFLSCWSVEDIATHTAPGSSGPPAQSHNAQAFLVRDYLD